MINVPFLELNRVNAPFAEEFSSDVRNLLARGWFIGGAPVEEFERSFADFCGTSHCVGTGNGLDALVLVLRALGIGPGDEVIVPAQTFVATWLAVSQVGAIPVGVDVQSRCGTLDPDLIEAAITPRTRAIMPVHLYGYTADMDRIMSIAARHGLRVIEDAAQAHGHIRFGRRAGAHGDTGCFSFYPAKNLGALGDAGAVVTNDANLANAVRQLGNYGSSMKYHHETMGLNSRLDPIQALLLSRKLAMLDEIIRRRRAIAAAYDEIVPQNDDGRAFFRLLRPGSDCVWHQYTILCRDRATVEARLASRRIGSAVHYPIIPSRQHCFKLAPCAALSFPVAEAISEHVLSLPIGEYLTEPEVAAVRDALQCCLTD